MSPRRRPRNPTRATAAAARVKVIPVRKADIDAKLFAQAVIAAQLLKDIASTRDPVADSGKGGTS